ncbi:MAG: hypothetical protein CVT97_05885 [Bacteroidetes bacterium HGW-Bacteroidetes-14]|nr:MAG: hypothetical protein CVT97_05885 [Bacteroidetes bacterium HGW-Bacteroidetes-14]
MYNNKRKTKPICFKRWKRTPWAAFASLGKVIKIGVLSVTYSILVMNGQPLLAQSNQKSGNDTIRALEELIINTERPTPFQPLVRVVAVIQQAEIERAAVNNLPDLLRYLQGTDLRTRGGEGVQSDLNILGGTFDQTMVMINGVNFTDPQTGHHSLNLPVEISQIERIEILHGPGAWSEGSVAYAGAINIITKSPRKTGASLSLSGGSFGYFKGDANLQYAKKSGLWNLSAQAGGGYGRSDGYAENTDFDILNLYTSIVAAKGSKHTIAAQAGYQHKAFGANSFYTAAYPEQFEETSLWLSSLQYTYRSGNWQIKAMAYHRRHFDRFELFRYEAAPWYKGHNYHRSDVAGADIQAARRWGKAGTTLIGAGYRFENIYSTVLGDPIEGESGHFSPEGIQYTRSKSRQTPSAYAKHILQLEKWRFTAGMLVAENMRIYGGASAAYSISPYLEANMWVNNSFRKPTFTDLYYKSPNQTGNMNLKPEEAVSGQLGLRYTKSGLKASLSGFYRYGFSIIDWTRASGSDQWQASNITNVITAGFEVSAARTWTNSFMNSAGVTYAYLDVSKKTDGLLSLYATDFLRHKATAFADHKIFGKLSARWDLSFQKREGTWLGPNSAEVPYKSFALADVKIVWSEPKWRVSVEATNLFGTDYLYLGNLPQPGRWIKAGLTLSL